ncbi:Acyl-CoA dehydrogenase [bacterium HR37]|jgi:alkylation response protein AidB-like acyl-CoA dehydrogenase|nr:Acyl-CoA dehydrogenase [bacterium HR37]
MSIIELTEEQRMVRDTAREFAESEIKPVAARLDKEGRFPSEIVKKLAELGFMGIFIPEHYGGSGMDTLTYVLALEEISKACASTGTIMSVNNSLVCDPIYTFGTEEQKNKYLIPLARGELLGCFSLSEPAAGSDAGSIRTTAVRDGNYYIINGTKNWVTNGPEADIIILFASTDLSKKHRGISAFIVEKETPGVIVGKVEDKLGIRASSTSQIIFEDCRVPVDNRLGEEGQGFKIAMQTLDGGRIGIGAQAVGIAQAAFEDSIRYSKQRESFGQPISEFQAIQFMLADMATRIEASRLLVWQAAVMKDKKLNLTKYSSMAKLYASETAMWVTTKAIQIHGGYGYTTDYPVERYFRDAKITEIYEGTSEIQRLVIARRVLNEYGF